jgi:sec-independent protein translocase protein TatA
MSGGELILIAVVALVLFGANKIPTFMKGLGEGIKEFKKASTDVPPASGTH